MIQKLSVFIFFVLNLAVNAHAQEVIFGANNYVEYQVGTLPIVISVSHGGRLEPNSIPDRLCNDPVYVEDAFTVDTALEIKNSLFEATGCYPHIIISHLKRNKLDPNRNLRDGACGNIEAVKAWNEFHSFIKEAQNTANQQYNNQTFFVDLHGHGNPIQRIELGYLLYDDELELTDYTLNTTKYINYSSIKKLALNNVNNYTHAQLLRGAYSLGTYLTNQNYPSVPSQSTPAPGTHTNYFSGGYITANHTSYKNDVYTNGVQMELNYRNIRDTPANRTSFANAFSDGIIEYMNSVFDVQWNDCTPSLSVTNSSTNEILKFYPNPVFKGENFNLKIEIQGDYNYIIFNSKGQNIKHGGLSLGINELNTSRLEKGIYFIKVSDIQGSMVVIRKLIVN